MSAVAVLPSIEHKLRDAYLDFEISREAMNCTPKTLQFYGFTARKFVAWLEDHEVADPAEVTGQHVHLYLSECRQRELKDTSLHAHARAIRTLLRFWHREGYMPDHVQVDMPKLERKRLPMLDADQLRQLLDKGCRSRRDKALVLLMVDTGLRRAEVAALDWGDLDLKAGLVRVRRGKGGRARSVVVGAQTRRSLMRYRRQVRHSEGDPVFQSLRGGGRLTGGGLHTWLRRMGERAGVRVSAHALRRTFATLSLSAGMDALHLQALLGHSTLEMVRRYVQMVERDLVAAHRKHGPVDKWLR